MSNLSDLKQLGAFIQVDELVRREIKFRLTDEEDELTAVIHVRRLSIGIHEAIWADGPAASISKTARLLAEAIRLGESGEEKMSYEQAFSLHPRIALAMSTAISDVNGGERKN